MLLFTRSLHGTTVQVVQPLTKDMHRSAPTTEEAMDCSGQGQGGHIYTWALKKDMKLF